VGDQECLMGVGHWENVVGHMYKCAVFDTKQSYSHKILIPGVYFHSTEISFVGGAVRRPDL